MKLINFPKQKTSRIKKFKLNYSTISESYNQYSFSGSISFQDSVNIMEPMHIFYKELPVDENNTFTADITKKKKKKNEVENV